MKTYQSASALISPGNVPGASIIVHSVNQAFVRSQVNAWILSRVGQSHSREKKLISCFRAIQIIHDGDRSSKWGAESWDDFIQRTDIDILTGVKLSPRASNLPPQLEEAIHFAIDLMLEKIANDIAITISEMNNIERISFGVVTPPRNARMINIAST